MFSCGAVVMCLIDIYQGKYYHRFRKFIVFVTFGKETIMVFTFNRISFKMFLVFVHIFVYIFVTSVSQPSLTYIHGNTMLSECRIRNRAKMRKYRKKKFLR